MTDHATHLAIERGHHHLAIYSCGWLRWAPDETTAREYARKHKPRPAKEGD